MSNTDDLLFGSPRVRDTDGDGVSDVQERLDGTDPNDSNDSIRQIDPIDIVTDDPRDVPSTVILERETIVDVMANLPDGKTVDQALPTGLDGEAIRTSPNHFGIGEDALLKGHMPASIGDVTRDVGLPAVDTAVPTGRDALTDTFGRAPGPNVNTPTTVQNAPPPGEEITGTADPGNNTDLVSETPVLKEFVWEGTKPLPTKENPVHKLPDFDEQQAAKAKAAESTRDPAAATSAGAGLDNLGAAGNKRLVDPDADGGTGGTPTAEDLEHAVVVHGGATDVVEGYGGGPQIEGDAPPQRAIDFVKDPVEEDAVATTPTAPTYTPGTEVSHVINPDGGFDLPRTSVGGPTPNDGGDFMTASSAATAAEATEPSDGGIALVGEGGGGGSGVQSIADPVTGVPPAPATSDVSVEAAPAADEITALPTIDDAADAFDAPPMELAEAAPDGGALMETLSVEPFDVPEPSFVALDVDDSLAVPDEVDLDDGF